jgi:hypothetical protein
MAASRQMTSAQRLWARKKLTQPPRDEKDATTIPNALKKNALSNENARKPR